MSDIMRILYDYVQSRCLFNYLDRCAHQAAADLEERNLNALEAGLNEKQRGILERYQEAAMEKASVEMEAMFQAAFAMARELP